METLWKWRRFGMDWGLVTMNSVREWKCGRYVRYKNAGQQKFLLVSTIIQKFVETVIQVPRTSEIC